MHRLITIAALVLSFGISSADATKQVALVIGNDSYISLPDLNKARKDAEDMWEILTRKACYWVHVTWRQVDDQD
jgi:hypothetical protein